MRIKILAAVLLTGCSMAGLATTLSSPDQHISVEVGVTPAHTLTYAVRRDGLPIVLASALGLQLEGADLARGLTLVDASAVKSVADSYEMAVGKRRHIAYTANEQVFSVRNRRGQAMDVVFRVSNDGVAFRYVVAEPGLPLKKLRKESTSFAFAPATRAWLQRMQVAQTGWKNTNPAYEEHYEMDIPVGTVSPSPAGWVFPALFKSGENWALLTEADMDGSYQASRLQAASPHGIYTIGVPMAAEVFPGGALLAQAEGTLRSPWRVIAVGSLATLMDSTLGTDLAAPATPFDPALVKPGIASWSWALLKDEATVYDVQKKFIDYAAEMHWDYTLIDADWDRKIGYDKIKQLADYAASRQVGLILWYNSSGPWNQTDYSPKSALLTHEQRIREFARLRAMGIKGMKIDFFGGDGKSMIAYYLAILHDAADYGLLVNFHGATLPRGWTRTYPNLMTMEAVRGLEYTTFTQADQDAMATHAAMLPFARNIFDPMDFTPMVFGDVPNLKRATRNGFEIALPVLFLSGIQHLAEVPEVMAAQPAYVRQFLQQLPRRWDDSRFLAGFPGKYVALARRAGDAWYVAGINAQENDQSLTLDLSFIGATQGSLIGDGDTPRAFTERAVEGGKALSLTLRPHGGFVAVFK